MGKPTTTTTTPVPRDAPDELVQQFGALMALAQANQPAAKDDPPVWQSGYWDYDESTGKQYWVNYTNQQPLSKAKLSFYNLSDQELRRFQELAYQAGYYGSTAERSDVRWGAKDDDTFEIWSNFNERAARAGLAGKQSTVWDLLQDDVDKRPESLNKGRKRAPLVTQLPNPTDVKDLVLSVSQDVLGREVDDQFINDFTAMYTKMVEEFQKNKYALEGTEEGGTITAPPSPESLARFRLRYERPEQYEEKAAAQRQNAYLSLLKGAL